MNALTEFAPVNGEAIPPATGLYAAVAAQIDRQVTTARAFPRNLSTVGNMLGRYLDSAEMAESCVYTLERESAGEKKIIQGPSARFAEALAYAYGHLRVDARVVDEKHDFIVVRGEAHDLERNVVYSQDVVRRIVGSRGKRFGPDMIAVTAMAAATIAQRDCVLKLVPSFIWRPAFDAVLQRVAGDTKTLADRRIKAVGQFSVLGVSAQKVFKKLGVSSINEVTAPHLVRLFGTFQAIKDGESTIESEFGAPRDEERKSTASPLAAPEDNGTDSGHPSRVEVAEKSTPKPDQGEVDSTQDPVDAAVAAASPTNSASAQAKEAARTFEDVIPDYRDLCARATSLEHLRKVAAQFGPLWPTSLTARESTRIDEVFEAAKASLDLAEKESKAQSARSAYEAARDPTDIDSASEVYRDGPAEAPEKALLEPFEQYRPRDLSYHETWENIVLDFLGAETESDLMERFRRAETDGRVGKLPEGDQNDLRAVRFKIKKLRGWNRK
jgi:hypothetical protein